MTGEREPDVIERMVMAFLDQYAKDQSNMDAPMLAAVRELKETALGVSNRNTRVADWIDMRIHEHERRAGESEG